MIARVIASIAAASVLLCTGARWALADELSCGTGSSCRAVALHPSPVAAPAGAHVVGRIDTALTDHGRTIMVSAWYPAAESGEPAPYVPATGPAAQAQIAARAAEWMHAPAAAAAMIGAQAAATEGAPVDGDRLPIVVVSPGMGTPRFILSGLAAELASRGYAVVAIDHTSESPAVELPDGRIILGTAPNPDTEYMRDQLAARTADMRLVLDRLVGLPIVGPHIDLDQVATLGHSYGGTAAVQLLGSDPRVRAAVSIDGPAGWAGVADAPTTDLPALLFDLTGEWTASWGPFRDERFDHVAMPGGGHYSASDLCALGGGADLCGTVPPDRAAAISRSAIVAWLDRLFRGGHEPRYSAPELHWQP
ncbi:hypothetical protein IRT45_35455 [Nocardia sp. BSTN01]|uniref:alpha/beta hydrolase family protein n=1 Tax=Nocardia sp. BSTN01 TaxID=2783665 RepID=UPI00188EBE60|nr:hypothetical protein [Nocardia sp. BSTN01]MBF5002416.1 hypothetical protein [Nocardia sp. BSTN01]